MRKIFLILLCAVFLFSFVGCKKETEEQKNELPDYSHEISVKDTSTDIADEETKAVEEFLSSLYGEANGETGAPYKYTVVGKITEKKQNYYIVNWTMCTSDDIYGSQSEVLITALAVREDLSGVYNVTVDGDSYVFETEKNILPQPPDPEASVPIPPDGGEFNEEEYLKELEESRKKYEEEVSSNIAAAEENN